MTEILIPRDDSKALAELTVSESIKSIDNNDMMGEVLMQ